MTRVPFYSDIPFSTPTLPKGKVLYPFQIEAIGKMVLFLPNCLNACEPGLGKTIQAIVLANTLEVKRVLILCPAIMRLKWKREWSEWSTERFLISAILGSDQAMSVLTSDIVITSYDLLRSKPIRSALIKKSFDMIIYDECHYLKNYKSQRSKIALGDIWNLSTCHIFLSGTPFTTSVVDAFPYFHKCMPERFPNFYRFAEEFSYIRNTNWGREYYGVKDPDKLNKIISSNFYLRYLKKDVLKDLPPKQWIEILLGEEYKASAEKLRTDDPELEAILKELGALSDKDIEAPGRLRIPKHVSELRRDQGLAKVPAIVDYAKNLLDQEIPVVIFGYHVDVMRDLFLKLNMYNPRLIIGETPSDKRSEYVEDFQSGKTNLILLNMLAGGVGITLTRSSNVILAELSFVPAHISQAVDRCHRIGTTETVNIHYFVVQNSIDERITKILMKRTKDFKAVLDGETHNG